MATATIDTLFIPNAPEDRQQIEDLHRLLHREARARLVGPGDEPSLELPEAVYALLKKILDDMRHGKVVSLVPVTQDLTTQQAAELLGVSRPYLVKLLEAGELAFHSTGTHRRVYLKDLLAYKKQRDRGRHRVLDQMAAEADAAGLYDQVLMPIES